MSVAKLSVSLPDSLAGFVEKYRKKRGLNRSKVIEEAVKLLRSRELEAAYRAADAKSDKAWETTASDGLADETW
jgi:antitoxin ParD1/3/4